MISNLLQSNDVTARSGNNPPPFRIVDPSAPLFWCTTDKDGNHINMTFSQPVVMAGFLSSGATTASESGYVSNFSILYSESTDGPLHRYPKVCVYRLHTLSCIFITYTITYIVITYVIVITYTILHRPLHRYPKVCVYRLHTFLNLTFRISLRHLQHK